MAPVEHQIDNCNGKNSLEEQQARTFLRERFLKCISNLAGNKCTMKTIEITDVSGVFQGMDINVQTLLINNLSTPYAALKHSLVRTSDLIYLDFPEAGQV